MDVSDRESGKYVLIQGEPIKEEPVEEPPREEVLQLAELGSDEKELNKAFIEAEAGPDEEAKPAGALPVKELKLDLDEPIDEVEIKINTKPADPVPETPASEVKADTAVASAEDPKTIPVQEAPVEVKPEAAPEVPTWSEANEAPPSPEPVNKIEEANVKIEAAGTTQAEVKETSPEPGKEADFEKLEAFYKQIGDKIIEGWRDYLHNYEKSLSTPEVPRKTVLDITKICEEFNNERKSEGLEAVDSHPPVMSSLKEIYNQIVILRLTDGKNPRAVESLSSVMAKELGQLINIGAENWSALEDYLTTVAEQLDSGQESAGNYISRDELGREIIALAKEEIEKHGDIPNQEVLTSVFESTFGERIKVMGLFELGVLAKGNAVIRDAAQTKNIQNIVRLTEAFAKYLESKKAEKEQKTKDFLTKKMAQMAA